MLMNVPIPSPDRSRPNQQINLKNLRICFRKILLLNKSLLIDSSIPASQISSRFHFMSVSINRLLIFDSSKASCTLISKISAKMRLNRPSQLSSRVVQGNPVYYGPVKRSTYLCYLKSFDLFLQCLAWDSSLTFEWLQIPLLVFKWTDLSDLWKLTNQMSIWKPALV